MHSMLLSGDGLIIPLKTGVLSKLNLLLTQAHTHADMHASGIPSWEHTITIEQLHTNTHMKMDFHGRQTDTRVKTRILSQTNLLLSGS